MRQRKKAIRFFFGTLPVVDQLLDTRIQSDTATMPLESDYILTLSCPDKEGIIHAVTGIFAKHGHNVLDLQQFSDPVSRRFFMRVHFGPTASSSSTEHLAEPFATLAAEYAMTYAIRPVAQKMRVLIMVSKIGHCLNDLLFRMKAGQLRMEVGTTARGNLPSFHLTSNSKQPQRPLLLLRPATFAVLIKQCMT